VSQSKRRRIDVVRSPEFTKGLDTISIDDLRRRRKICSDLDVELSYYRRLLHGRMDLLAFELRRRRGLEQRTLLEALPEILAGGAAGVEGLPERQVDVAVPRLPEKGRRAVDRALGDDFLARLPNLPDEELVEIQTRLTEVETEVSAQRRDVYRAYDLIQEELTRRYREGLVSVDELLRKG
jgi:hypothetical protein